MVVVVSQWFTTVTHLSAILGENVWDWGRDQCLFLVDVILVNNIVNM